MLRAGWGLLAAAGLAAALTACSAGQEAQTAFQSPGIDGANGNADGVAVRAVTIAFPNSGRYAEGADAQLNFVVANTTAQADALVEVRTDAAQRVTFATPPPGGRGTTASETGSPTPPPTTTPAATTSPAATPSGSATGSATTSATTASPTPLPTPVAPTRVDIPAGTVVTFKDDGPSVTLNGLTRELIVAQVVQVTFVFEKAGEVTLSVPVAVPLTEVSAPPTIDLNPTEGG